MHPVFYESYNIANWCIEHKKIKKRLFSKYVFLLILLSTSCCSRNELTKCQRCKWSKNLNSEFCTDANPDHYLQQGFSGNVQLLRITNGDIIRRLYTPPINITSGIHQINGLNRWLIFDEQTINRVCQLIQLQIFHNFVISPSNNSTFPVYAVFHIYQLQL